MRYWRRYMELEKRKSILFSARDFFGWQARVTKDIQGIVDQQDFWHAQTWANL